MVPGVVLVNAILPNIYQVLGIGFLKVLSHGDLSNLKAFVHCPLTTTTTPNTHSQQDLVPRKSGKTVSGYKQRCAILQYQKATKACRSVGVQVPSIESSH